MGYSRLILQYRDVIKMFSLARDGMPMEEVGRKSGDDSRACPVSQERNLIG